MIVYMVINMKNWLAFFLIVFTLIFVLSCSSGGRTTDSAIISGIAWFDDNLNEVNAHASCIVKQDGIYYLFGEAHTDDSNEYTGFNCYSSTNLVDWKFENKVLGLQPDGLLGPGRVGERAKVMKCPSTGQYVMYMHTDDLKYNDPHVGYAVSDEIDGDYCFMGDLKYGESYIRRWDLSVFQDTDGKGYILTHEGNIYRLAPDYCSVDSVLIKDAVPGGEAPAMFKSNGTYYWIFSNKTSWERNDNYYYTATSLSGPWEYGGLLCPEGKTTWNSQSAFVLPIKSGADTLFVYMGDRWSYPKQASAATYVWQPLTVNEDGIGIPHFSEAWKLDEYNASWHVSELDFRSVNTSDIVHSGTWNIKDGIYGSNETGASLVCTVNARQIAVYGISDNHCGYANLKIMNSKGEEVLSTVMDFYSQYCTDGIKFLSPVLDKDEYTIMIELDGTWAESVDKSGNHFGSDDCYVFVSDIAVAK